MKHNNEWLSKRIMESIGKASAEMQADVCKITNGTPLQELENQTLRRIFDMIISAEAR